MNDVGQWVNLLRTPQPRSAAKSRLLDGEEAAQRHVKVLENTPQGKVGVKKSKRSEVQVLRSQVASLVKEKRDLGLSAAKGEQLLNSARDELQTALQVNSQAKAEMEDQRRVIHKLSADNAKLIRQVESLWQQSPGMKSPNRTYHSPHDHTHNNVLVKDLERLSQRATELSQALTTTQQSRTALEREVLSLKRTQLELQTSRSQLEEALAKSEEERAGLCHALQETQEASCQREEQLQLQLETAVAEKTAKLEEMLSLSERLESAVTILTREKSVLEHSLREEVTNNQQLTAEKQGLAVRVAELEASLSETRRELSHMQDSQLHEVTEMKTLLENEMTSLQHEMTSLQQEREVLSRQVEAGREEREMMEQEVEATRGELTSAEDEIERLTEKVATLEDTLSHVEGDRASELSQLTAQLAEMSARCEEMDRERNDTQTTNREQVEGLTNQLRESAVHIDQLEAETEQLQTLLNTASHDLQAKSRDLDSTHSKLHATQMAKAHMEQQVSDLEDKVLALNEQISSRTELTNEMRALLDQRTNQIQELEDIVSQQREDLLSGGSHTHLLNNHTHLYSDDSTHILQATPIKSPYGSRPLSPEPRPLATPSSDNMARLRKQLAKSRQDVLKLETTCEEIRTELAKQLGSVQALTAIKERLTEENNSLLDAKRRLEEGQRSAEEGRRRAEEGKKALSRQLTSLQSMVTSLRAQVSDLRGEKEEAMSQISELQETYAEREAELAEELAAMEERSVAVSDTTEVERDYLQLELAKSRARNTELEQHVVSTQHFLEKESGELQSELERCVADLCTLRGEDMEVQEECRLTAAVNAKQTNQIAEKEGCVSELLGEVEVLRARKSVMLKWLCDPQEDKSLKLELESVYEQLQQCQVEHAAEMTSLTQRLEEEGRRGRGEGGALSMDSRDSLGERRGKGVWSNKRTEHLRLQLKNQIEQSNYLRVKLGYTLKELQLYKELKTQLDSQLSQQAQEMTSLQEHHTECLRQLQQVERLGFQATVQQLPSNICPRTVTNHL